MKFQASLNPEPRQIHRREWFRAGALASAAVIVLDRPGLCSEPNATGQPLALPVRVLGGSGLQISILGLEASQSPESLDRLLRVGYANGVRYFDTADCYASSEQKMAGWLKAQPEVRKTILLSTKDHPAIPSQLRGMLDRRLAALGIDSVDLFFIHSLGNHHTVDEAVALVTSNGLKGAVEAIKKSGKARLVGFSTQHRERARIIEAAARAGFIDVMMIQYTAWPGLDRSMNDALDLAHRQGIGLIAMKPGAGINPAIFLAEASRRKPALKEQGLSAFQSLLHSIWSDERISCCSLSMQSTDQIRECVEAARKFEPTTSPASIPGFPRLDRVNIC